MNNYTQNIVIEFNARLTGRPPDTVILVGSGKEMIIIAHRA